MHIPAGCSQTIFSKSLPSSLRTALASVLQLGLPFLSWLKFNFSHSLIASWRHRMTSLLWSVSIVSIEPSLNRRLVAMVRHCPARSPSTSHTSPKSSSNAVRNQVDVNYIRVSKHQYYRFRPIP